MNLTPTEVDRLTIFTAAELARRYRSLGIKLSHPEAVALICDEVMTAARQDLAYTTIRDLAGRILTTDDVQPGVAEMIPLIGVEISCIEGTKLLAIFDPIAPGLNPVEDLIVPGEIITPDEMVQIFPDADTVMIEVINTGDRDVQVRSHAHFFEVNRALCFDRATAWGRKLDIACRTPSAPRLVMTLPSRSIRSVTYRPWQRGASGSGKVRTGRGCRSAAPF